MLSLTKGAHIAKLLPAGCLCWLCHKEDQNQNEPRDQFTSSHPDDISGLTKWEKSLHLISLCVPSVHAEPFHLFCP